MTSAASIPTVTLNDENTIPVIGLGVAELSDSETEQAVSAALEAGYRLIDTASAYGNEEAVGRAIAASGVPRDELFITTKLATEDQGFQAAQDACTASIERLGLDYVDLYLIHWPGGDPGKYVDSWGGLMKRRQDGVTKSIGVSNFHAEDLSNVIDLSFVTPAINQIELHPLLNQAELRAVNAELRHRHRGVRPAGRRQAAGKPDGCVGGAGARQDAGAGADPVEHPAGQRRHPPIGEPGTDQVEYRRVRLRVDRRRDGRAQRLWTTAPASGRTRKRTRH